MASDDDEGLTREEAKRILRRLELDAYSSIITAFRAQGDLNREKKQALSDLAAHLSISNERHRAEVRRVVNDDSLNTIAECLHGVGTVTEWSFEGKRLVSLTPRLVPQTVFTAKATHTANAVSQENSKLPIKKSSSSSPRDRALLLSSKFEKFEEKFKAQDDNPPELGKGSALAKGQDADKAKKKKKQNQAINKVLKPSKLNLQSKTECRSSSSTSLSKNLLSPTNLQRTVLPETSRGTFHQKPIILQRSPHKATSNSRPQSADSTVSTQHPHSQKQGLSLGNSSAISSSAQQVLATSESKGVSTAASNTPTKSSQALDPASNTYIVQKMKFKTPVAKSKAKPLKPKAGAQLSRPSSICVSHGSESLNVLATSTVVPMAPISPVKSVVPSNSGQNTITSNADGTEDGSYDAVKVIQMQKSGNFAASQPSSVNSSPKSFVVVSSSTTAKAGNAQRVVALGNVPISGNQQLKIATIPNVLQQSGAKIVSIAKSMPMTTGLKMIAVTTVVPGSTQVKTVYIATPIVSVTKTSSQSQGDISNQASATKLLQTLVSGSATPARPAQTDVSPSNLVAPGKPSLGMVNSRGFAPAPMNSLSSVVKSTVSTATSSIMSTVSSTGSIPTTSVATCKADAASGSLKSGVSPKEEARTVSTQKTTKFPERQGPISSAVPSITVKTVANDTKLFHTNTVDGKPSLSTIKNKTSLGDRPKCRQDLEETVVIDPPSDTPGGSSLCDNADETILLAGEKFLADLAAKFSKHTNEVSPANSESGCDSESVSEPVEGNFRSAAVPKIENPNCDSKLRPQMLNNESKAASVNESKVIVRKISDEYNSPLKLPTASGEAKEIISTVTGDQINIAIGQPTAGLANAQSACPKDSRVVSHISNKPGTLDIDSGALYAHGSSGRFESPTITTNCNSSVKDEMDSVVEAQESSSLQMRESSGEGKAFSGSQDQPRNIFASFFPTNGSADKELKIDLKSNRVLSPLIHSPTNLSAESSQNKHSSLTSPVRSPVSIKPISYRKAAVHEVKANNTLLPEINCDGPAGPCGSTGPCGPTGPSRQNLSANFHAESPQKLADGSQLQSAVVNSNYSDKGRNIDKSPRLEASSMDSNSSAYTSPLNSPKDRSSPLSRWNSDKKVAVPLLHSDAVRGIGNEGHSEEYGLQPNHSGVVDRLKTDVADNIILSNSEEALPDGQKSLKHSPRAHRANAQALKLDQVPSECQLSLEFPANTSGGLSLTQEHFNNKAGVTDNGRGTSKKRKSDAVISVGWIKSALSLLHKVSRFRGPNKQKGEMNAASWFTRPVDPAEAPGYYKVIKNPMDFGTVRKKLEGGAYKDFAEFYSDMHLIKSNCYTYNPAEHMARKDCDLVFTFFEEECYKLLQKQQNALESPSKKSKVDVTV